MKSRLTNENGSPTKDHAIYEQQYKLRDLEDIEEELGIDLATLIRASEHIYIKFGNEIDDIILPYLNVPMKCFETEYKGIYYFKDYGITWALTKEELE